MVDSRLSATKLDDLIPLKGGPRSSAMQLHVGRLQTRCKVVEHNVQHQLLACRTTVWGRRVRFQEANHVSFAREPATKPRLWLEPRPGELC